MSAISAVISIYENFGVLFTTPPEPEDKYILFPEEIVTEDAEFEIIEPKQLPQ